MNKNILKYIWFCPKCGGHLIDDDDFLHYRDLPKTKASKFLDILVGEDNPDDIVTNIAGDPCCKCGGPGHKLRKATEEDREFYREEREFFKKN